MNFQHARKTLVEGSIIEALLPVHTRALLNTVNIKFQNQTQFLKHFEQPGGLAHQG